MQKVTIVEDYTSPTKFKLPSNPETVTYLMRISYDSHQVVLEQYFGSEYSEIIFEKFHSEWCIESLIKQARKIIGRSRLFIDSSVILDDDE